MVARGVALLAVLTGVLEVAHLAILRADASSTEDGLGCAGLAVFGRGVLACGAVRVAFLALSCC